MKPVPRSRTNDLLACLVVAVAYVAAGVFGLSLASVNKSASAVWPPTGIALASFLCLGYRIWPGIMAGAFLVNFVTAGTALTSLRVAVGKTRRGAPGCSLVRRFSGGAHVLERTTPH